MTDNQKIKQVFIAFEAAHSIVKNADCKCGPGCSWCCRIIPQVTRAETQVIRKYAKENNINIFIGRKGYCPLLDLNDTCSVYSVRPIMCRGWLSTDIGFCKSPPQKFALEHAPVLHDKFKAVREIHRKLCEKLDQTARPITNYFRL